jgi:anti-sigma regulatory factor (Ser/Thr protein kinase)
VVFLEQLDGIHERTVRRRRTPARLQSVSSHPLSGNCRDIEAAMRLSSEPASARAARAFVSTTLGEWGCAELDDTVKLLTSELVGNVVRHAHTEMMVSVRLEDSTLAIEVIDDSPDMLVQRSPHLDEPTGRGLLMINSMADRWGVRRRRSGKSVWFELDLLNQNPSRV